MNRQIFLLILFLACSMGKTQAEELEFSGYYENQFFPQELNGKVILQDYNKLRLDLFAEISENVNFSGDYIFRIFHGTTEFNTFDLIPENIVQNYAEIRETPVDSLRPLFDFAFEDENFLDNAYLSLYSKHLNVRVGKQQLPWGTGYTWNPTDIFNEKKILDPTYEKVGIDAFKLELPFGREGMLTAILSIGDQWRTSAKALKIKQYFCGFDLSGSFVEKEEEEFDYFSFTATSERRRLFGGDFSGELLGLGVWGEGAYNQMEASKDYGQYLLGSDYTFENGLYLTGEYYKNELGKTDKNQYTINDWMRLLSADGENLGEDYIFLGERYPLSELGNWSNYVLVNLNDKSGIIFPWFDYTLSDNTELIFAGYIPFGEEETEFGELGMGGAAKGEGLFLKQ